MGVILLIYPYTKSYYFPTFTIYVHAWFRDEEMQWTGNTVIMSRLLVSGTQAVPRLITSRHRRAPRRRWCASHSLAGHTFVYVFELLLFMCYGDA